MNKEELITFMLDRCVADREFFEALKINNCLDDKMYFDSIHHRGNILEAVRVLHENEVIPPAYAHVLNVGIDGDLPRK